VSDVTRKGGVSDPAAVCAAAKRKAGEQLNRRNPLNQAREAFRATHGYEPENDIVTVEEEHYHEYLPAWGELIDLVIVPTGERKGVRLTRFKGAMLAFSEQYESSPQLHIVGGDQSCDPTVFGILTNHELETLGKCVDITYYTVKTHLGRDGGDANYVHAFAEETAKRKARHVRILNSPDVIYDRLNEKLKFSGGVYEITPEGIRD
jgi:hypothetical protein